MSLNNRLKPRKKKGFTLIELLVVIAIIALLLSMLMPALNKAKEQGKSIVCASHLRQWGIVLSLYTTDYKDKFPSNRAGPRGQWWFLPLRPYYIEQPEILICGKAKRKQDPDTATAPWVADGRYWPQKNDECWGREIINNSHAAFGEWVWSSYGPNGWLGDIIDGRWSGAPDEVPDTSFWGKMDRITTPAQVPFYLDSKSVDAWPHDTNMPPDYEYPSDNLPSGDIGGDPGMRTFTILRHSKSINAVMGDGSVERVRTTELWGLKWHKTFKIRNDYTNGTNTFPGWMK